MMQRKLHQLRLQSRIPKRIIHTAKHADPPLRTRAMMENLRVLNPDFEYLFSDD